MVCTLTPKQQRLLFGKVAIDLKNLKSFDFKNYSKQFYNFILNKTNDPVLATMYVSLLPMNIRVVSGVNKEIYGKLVDHAPEIFKQEKAFEDIQKVEQYVNELTNNINSLINLEKDIQQDSLTKPVEQAGPVNEKEITPQQQASLWDSTMDVDDSNFLRPEMKIYADAKKQLIDNVQPDGSSIIKGTPVRAVLASTQNFDSKDFYPDTQREIQAGNQRVIGTTKTGVVLLIVDMDGKQVRFNNDLSKNDNGKILFYEISDPKPGKNINRYDKAAIDRLVKERGLSRQEATSVVIRELNKIAKIRAFIAKDPVNNKVSVNLKGGVPKISAKTTKTVKVSAVDFSLQPFSPYSGIPAQGQKENVFYFNYPGTQFPITINRASVPFDLVQRLVQLLTEDVYVGKGSVVSKVSVAKKLELFSQFIYASPDVLSLSANEKGEMIVKREGVVVNYVSKQEMAKDLMDFFTNITTQGVVGSDYAKGKVKVKPVNRKFAQAGQVLEKINPDGTITYYMMGPFQMSINKRFVGNTYKDFNLNLVDNKIMLQETPRSYNEFIKDNFLIGYDVPQPAGSTLNFEIAPLAAVDLIKKENAQNQNKQVQKTEKPAGLSQEVVNAKKAELEKQKQQELKNIEIDGLLKKIATIKIGDDNFGELFGEVSVRAIEAQWPTIQAFASKGVISKEQFSWLESVKNNEFLYKKINDKYLDLNGDIEKQVQKEDIDREDHNNDRFDAAGNPNPVFKESLFDEKGNLNPKAYVDENPPQQSGINNVPADKKLSAKEKLLKFKKDNPKGFDKLFGQKGLEATVEQIEQAEKWYNNHPMSAYFPFDAMFDVVNQKNSNSIARWTSSGITLYKGADFSDLYHEAWHGFTQGFLSGEQKNALYNDARKKSGLFTDFNGNTVKFKDATDLQVEEYYAEQFREYMLSGGKTASESRIQNSVFRKILNFLKKLFGITSMDQGVVDAQVNANVSELFRKLRVGDLSSYTFAAENRNFDNLNKSLQSINSSEVQKSLSFENSALILSTVDSLFSEGIDVLNAANIEEINERRTLQAKQDKTPEEKIRLKELNAQNTSGYTTAMLTSVKGITALYDYAKSAMEDRLAELIEENNSNPSTELENNIGLLQYALRNFGDVENVFKNQRDTGVIGYHLFKSTMIDPDIFVMLQTQAEAEEFRMETEEILGRELEGKEYFDRGGNEVSIFDLASREIRNLIKSLNKTDAEGNVLNNRLGFPQLVSFRETFAYIARTVQNSADLSAMYSLLEKESAVYPPIKQLLDKLGPLSYEGQTDKEVDMWSKFFQTFNKYRINLVQTTLNATLTKEEQTGTEISQYNIRIGNALADYKAIDREWKEEFKKANADPFVRNDQKGNYLLVDKILKKYPDLNSVNANPFNFLHDIGIRLSDMAIIHTELAKEIHSGNIRLGGIYHNLQKLQELKFPVRSLSAFLANNEKHGIVGQTGSNSNYGKILMLQSRYSGEYSDFMVKNAAGDPQSEYTQNNSLTQLVKQINAVSSYNELINNAATAQYNNQKGVSGLPFNPWINASIWMRSLFDMNANGGSTTGNEMVIENLSGVNSSVNDEFFREGVATAESDEVTALLNAFHVQLMKYTPELTRHAGKKTSLAVSLRNYNTGARNKRLYIDTENFVGNPSEFNQGFDDFYNIVIKYIGAELDRVNYSKELLADESLTEFDFNYLNRGTKFVAFDGVLSEQTKQKLYGITNLQEFLNSSEGTGLSNILYDEVLGYFNKLTDGVSQKLAEHEFISPDLFSKTKQAAEKAGAVNITQSSVRRALVSSFVANNWIHHFEEMIMLYGDIAQYKDFFKRNASLNSTGDIIRNDASFINHVNSSLKKPFALKAGVKPEITIYNGILTTAVSADVMTSSVYLDEYKKAVKSPTVDGKYGKNKINEADAQGLIAFDTYRIILKSLSKWTAAQEKAFQEILNGVSLDKVDATNIFPVLKMGYFGPVANDKIPLTALHKFALMPLIPGLSVNLDKLHNKMMQEGIDYHTFESGSKVSTIAARKAKADGGVENGFQPFYSDLNTRTLNTQPFIKNKVFVEYLKYQVEAKPKFKGKMTLPTQLRKLAELGLMEKGIPTDFHGTKEQWAALNAVQKRAASENYRLRQHYIRDLKELVEFNKNKILADIGWKRDKNGKLVGDMEPLLKLISSELKRADVGDHEWEYIQTIRGNDIKNSIDISQSAEMIEKVITAFVNKRLINMKVRGEQLVAVSTTGFEDTAFAYGPERQFENPTDEDKRKYGSNDLPTYHIRNGKIAAAKVKIAIQGDFKLLLQLEDVKNKARENGVSRLAALNLLLKNEDWLEEGENRAMVSMVGARIPTQGLNSADFMEVYEFLPEIAGNIIVGPSEITSKSGGDFDYDKLPLMMPNIRIINGKPELAKKYSEEQAKQAYNVLVKYNIHKLTFQGLDKLEIRMLLKTSDRFEKVDAVVAKLLGPDYYEQLANIIKEDHMTSFEVFFENLNGSETIENNIQQSLRAILERKENLGDLIRPNDTDIVKPLADDIKKEEEKDKPAGYDKQGTRMFEILHNIKVQQANYIGKDTLGIGAISNAFNAVFNSTGVSLAPEYINSRNKFRRAALLFKHNDNNGGISLSNAYDGLNENNIADVISQLINGWVDVEKDDWISYIQGNKEVAPVMLFMIQAGVPIKDVVRFVTQPVILNYVKAQRLAKSSFADVLGGKKTKFYKQNARKEILAGFGMRGFFKEDDIYQAALAFTEGIEDFGELLLNRNKGLESSQQETGPAMGAFASIPKQIQPEEFEEKVTNLYNKVVSAKEAKFLYRRLSMEFHPDKGGDQELFKKLNNINEAYKNGTLEQYGNKISPKEDVNKKVDIDFALFLHYLEIENMATEVTKTVRAFNVDTTALQSLTEFYGKISEISDLMKPGGLIPKEFIEQIKNNSPIGPFYIQEFALELFSRVLPLRNSKVVNDFLNQVPAKMLEDLFDLTNQDERLSFYRTFKNDLFSYIFQNQVRKYTPDGSIDNQKAEDDFKAGAFVEAEDLPGNAFVNIEEYKNYLQSKELIKKAFPFSEVRDTLEFELYLNRNQVKDGLKKEDESEEDFSKRLREISYDQYVRDKALYNIFSPYQLFKSDTGIVGTYDRILALYPQLKQYFSLLNNVKESSKSSMNNLMPATLKFDKDEIDTFYENFQNLANSAKLMELPDIDQRDADFISSFFEKLPLYLYMQAGPNTRNPFSFARMMPNDKVLSVLDKPVKDLTLGIDEKYLNKFLARFIVANFEFDTRNRFKEFMQGEQEQETEEKPTEMQLKLFGKQPVEKEQFEEILSTEPVSNVQVIDKKVQYTKERFDAALGTSKTFMSNFHQLTNPIVDEFGNEFWNSEGYYMSLRTKDSAIKKEIAEDSKAGGQASRGARRKYDLEMDEIQRGKMMLETVRKKFLSNPDLAQQLLATGDQEIIEKNYWKDDLFGVREDTLQGSNVLGKVLMRVRKELQNDQPLNIQPPKQVSDDDVDDAINNCK